MDGFYDKPVVLVVHCVDTEGPIGGNVRRRNDGSKEFMDNWKDIKNSLEDITCKNFRQKNLDSSGNLFFLNWFIMDFTGFKTNPKNRIQEYNDTYDNIKSLNTHVDSFHWHYHQPPKSGIGDMWSNNWNDSDEHYNILGHRIMHRHDFPEAYRAGGTIEDNTCSLWLEDNFMIDYSNRVSDQSYRTDDIFDFNWHGAPNHWGYYHPSRNNFLKKGKMKRYIARSVDLESRLHVLTQEKVNEAFRMAKEDNKPVILSYFSHDHRDMREETYKSIKMIKKASESFGIDFLWSDALSAVQISAGIKKERVTIGYEKIGHHKIRIYFSKDIYQKSPFVYTEDKNGKMKYHNLFLHSIANCPYYFKYCILNIDDTCVKIGTACTSLSGDKSILVKNIRELI